MITIHRGMQIAGEIKPVDEVDIEEDGYIIPAYMLGDINLSTGARLLYAALYSVAKQGTNPMRYTNKQLALAMNCSEPTIKRYIRQLDGYAIETRIVWCKETCRNYREIFVYGV